MLFTFDNSGDLCCCSCCCVASHDVDDDDDCVSTLDDRRRSSPRLISVAERMEPRFGDLVLRRRWKKLPPLAPWWCPVRSGLLAARNDR